MDLGKFFEEFEIRPESGEVFNYQDVIYTKFRIPKHQIIHPLEVDIELCFDKNKALKYFRLRPLKMLNLCKVPFSFEPNHNSPREQRGKLNLTLLDDQSILHDLNGWEDFTKKDVEEKVIYFLDFLDDCLQNFNSQVKEKTLTRNKEVSEAIPGYFRGLSSIKPENMEYFREVSKSLYEKITKNEIQTEFKPFFITKMKNNQNEYFFEAYFWKDGSLRAVNSNSVNLANEKTMLEGFYNKIFNPDSSPSLSASSEG